MKKGQICEGVIQRVDFPNKGMVYVGTGADIDPSIVVLDDKETQL